MYLEVQDDKKMKESKVVEQKRNILPAKGDLHSDVHVQYKREPYLNVGIQPKQENMKGTGIIQKEPGLEVGTHVYVHRENKIGIIVEKLGNDGYVVRIPDSRIEKITANEVQSMYSHNLQNSMAVFDSVMREGVLPPSKRSVQPGAWTEDSKQPDYKESEEVSVNRLDTRKPYGTSGIEKMFANLASGPYVIALEDANAPKIILPSIEECRKKLENMNIGEDEEKLCMDEAVPEIYFKYHSGEFLGQVGPVLMERFRRSMLVIANDAVGAGFKKDEKVYDVMETTVNGILPDSFEYVLLPDNSIIPQDIAKKYGNIKLVKIIKKTLELPAYHFFQVLGGDRNALAGVEFTITLPCPDYEGELKELGLTPGTYYSHLVRM